MYQSIEELIETLEQRKNEAIRRTFKQVAFNFERVFEKLVPAGAGKLLMRGPSQAEMMSEGDIASDGEVTDVNSYSGISITVSGYFHALYNCFQVSFHSKDEKLRIQQLSGGQKSLVALAFIFAIQQCDPAPFYLFDEIDANLDATYRTAVANLVHELSQSAQYITTTFRPELLVNANKFYGVTLQGKVSRIMSVTQDDAVQFLEQVNA